MKKRIMIPAAIAVLMGAGAYFGHATATPAEGLSDLELANAEALADKEAWVDIIFDKGCMDGGTEMCVVDLYHYYLESTPYN